MPFLPRNPPNLSWLGTGTDLCWLAYPVAWFTYPVAWFINTAEIATQSGKKHGIQLRLTGIQTKLDLIVSV